MAAKEQQHHADDRGRARLPLRPDDAIDGYPGQEHALPIYPAVQGRRDSCSRRAASRTRRRSSSSYGGPWGENYFYTTENVYDDPKLRRFTPYEELAAKTRRRVRGSFGGGNSRRLVHEGGVSVRRRSEDRERDREGRRPRRRRQPRPAPGTRLPLGAVDGAERRHVEPRRAALRDDLRRRGDRARRRTSARSRPASSPTSSCSTRIRSRTSATRTRSAT